MYIIIIIVEPLKGKLLCETTRVLCPLFGLLKLWLKTVKISILKPVFCSRKFLALRFWCLHQSVTSWKLFHDVLQVKFYLGIQEPGYDQRDEEEDTPPTSTTGALADMCHPLCQCQKCLSIQKVLTLLPFLWGACVGRFSGEYVSVVLTILEGVSIRKVYMFASCP